MDDLRYSNRSILRDFETQTECKLHVTKGSSSTPPF